MNSSLTLDPRIVENLRVMRERKLDNDIPTYLREIEKVPNPEDYMPSSGDGLRRGLGLGARILTQGIGNVAGLPFALAGAGYHALTGNQPPALLQGGQGTAAADQMGLPQPNSPGERMAVAAGENAVASLPFAAMGPGGIAAKAGQVALGGAAGLASSGASEAGAGPGGQLAASAIVGFGVPLVTTVGAAAIRSALLGAATKRQVAQESLALLQAGNPNAPVTLGQVAAGGMAREVEGRLRNIPGANATLRNTLEQQSTQMGQRVGSLANRFSPSGTPETAGAAVQRGITEGFVPAFRSRSAQLYNKVFQMVPLDTPVIPSNTINWFSKVGLKVSQDPPFGENLASPTIQKWGSQLAETMQNSPKGLQLGTLAEFRSKLGEMLSGADLVPDISMRDVKQLYGVVSEDMKAAIAQANPSALPAWERAQLHWKVGSERLEKVLQPLVDKRTPEVAFNALFSGSRDGATVLRSTMRSVTLPERRMVAATVLRRMGEATPGAQNAAGDLFSPESFLTNWNKFSPEAKSALFEGIDPRLTADVNALAKAAGLMRKAGEIGRHPPQTAPNIAFWSILTGLSAGGVGLASGSPKLAAMAMTPVAAALGSQQLASRVFTNAKMIHRLVRFTQIPYSKFAQELTILGKDAVKWDPESRDVAHDFIQHMGGLDLEALRYAGLRAGATDPGRSSQPGSWTLGPPDSLVDLGGQ